MRYESIVELYNGKTLIMRNACESDGEEVLKVFNQTHSETDYLLTYEDENSFTVEDEALFLKEKTESSNEVEIVAVVDGKIVGTAGIEAIGSKDKIKHRADFGISILKEYWGMGIGRRLTEACIECAKKAGYEQLELQAVAENEHAISMYQKAGFVEYGCNPRGFKSRDHGYQKLVFMRLEL